VVEVPHFAEGGNSMAQAPLSLYLDLESGEKADLEVISRASLALASAIREVAAMLDPSLEVRIEFDSGTEGSLSLNSIIRGIGSKITDRKVLAAVALTIVVYFGREIRDNVIDKAIDVVIPGFSEHFSDSEKKEISDIVAEAVRKGLGKPHVQDVYRELEHDPSVKGVGATTKSGTRPEIIVPRSQFPARGSQVEVIEEHAQERHRTPEVVVTLIKPVLEPGKRAWRFRDAHGEFSAVMDDQEFLEKVLSGRERVPMMQGLRFRVKMRVDEEKSPDGVWIPKARRVLKVIDTRRPPQQSTLGLTDMRPDEDDDDENKK
jgi:hypothetical protein